MTQAHQRPVVQQLPCGRQHQTVARAACRHPRLVVVQLRVLSKVSQQTEFILKEVGKSN